MSSYFLNKVCLVTGGSRGIGRAIADRLLQDGAKVTICDLNPVEGMDFVSCDVTNKKDLENVFKITKEKFGNIDVLVNNAGILKETHYEDEVKVNVLGVMHATNLALKNLTKGGLVINVSSLSALTPTPVTPAYGATKAAVMAYTRNLGSELYFQRHGIRFVCICPSFVLTDMADTSKWNPDDKVISAIMEKKAKIAQQNNQFLSPQELAEDLFGIVPTAENGSVWVLKKGNPPRLVPPVIYEF